MAEVRPLRGIRYNQELVGNITQVVTPPYDVISPQAQERYYARNPYNSIRLELGHASPEDNTLNNVYTRAAATLAEWRLQDVLQQDVAPSYYLYQQIFTHGEQSYTRTSLLARVRLEPLNAGVILPHEYTLAKAKNDRLQLLRACATNLSPIMSLYDDPQGRIRRMIQNYAEKPEVQFVDDEGVTHRLQPITDIQEIALIQDFFAERQLYIADGHHRYETALAYRQEVLEQRKELHPEDAVNFVLMALSDIDDPGILVLPTHRLLFGLSQEQLNQLSEQQLTQYFTVRQLGLTETSDMLLHKLAQTGQVNNALLICTLDQTMFVTLNEQGRQRMQESEGQAHSAAWNKLDVAIVQKLLLEDLLGLQLQDMTAGTHVRYTHDVQEALQAIQKDASEGGVQVALLLNGTPVRQMCEVAQADDRMPQKSTFFYPKLITGLVLNPLW